MFSGVSSQSLSSGNWDYLLNKNKNKKDATFEDLDANANGEISLDELTEALGDEEKAQKAMTRADRNQDGVLDEDELGRAKADMIYKRTSLMNIMTAMMEEEGVDSSTESNLLNYISGDKNAELSKEEETIFQKFIDGMKKKNAYKQEKSQGMLINISA